MTKAKSFAKIKEVYQMPGLLDIQVKSYEEFLQVDVPALEREPIGLQEAFLDVFPIESFDKNVRLEFISYTLGKPKYDVAECRRRDISYSASLKVKFRLITLQETKEQEAYFGEIPLMTESGTFIINGDERVVVSQFQRSPGLTFE